MKAILDGNLEVFCSDASHDLFPIPMDLSSAFAREQTDLCNINYTTVENELRDVISVMEIKNIVSRIFEVFCGIFFREVFFMKL